MTTDSSLTRNYILMGVALGSGFAVGVAFDNFLVRPKQPPLAELLQTNPLHYLVFLSPLVLGALFFLLARAQARAAALSESKRASEKSFERLVNSV